MARKRKNKPDEREKEILAWFFAKIPFPFIYKKFGIDFYELEEILRKYTTVKLRPWDTWDL